MRKFAISRLNLAKKDTFRQHIPFLGGGGYTTYLATLVKVDTKAPCSKVVLGENYQLSGYANMFSFKKRAISQCKTRRLH